MGLRALRILFLCAISYTPAANAEEPIFRAHVGDVITRPAGMWKMIEETPNNGGTEDKKFCETVLAKINEKFQVRDTSDDLSSFLRILTENSTSAPWMRVDQASGFVNPSTISYFQYDNGSPPIYIYRDITMLAGNASYNFSVTNRIIPLTRGISRDLLKYPVVGGKPNFSEIFPKIFLHHSIITDTDEDLMVLPNKQIVDLILIVSGKHFQNIQLLAGPIELPLHTFSLKAVSTSPRPGLFNPWTTSCIYAPTMQIDWY